MKKLVLISSHCDTDEKLKILKTNIEILKKLNVKILLYSSFNIDSDIIKLVDYYYYSKYNPISEYRSLLFWKEESYNNKNIKFCRYWMDNALAGLHQFKVLSKLSLNIEHDISYFTLYDLVYTNDVINFIQNENKESFFVFKSSENGKVVENEGAFQLFSLYSLNIQNFINLFNLDDFVKYPCAELFLAATLKRLNIELNNDFYIEDHIYQFREWHKDFYNYSIWDDFKIYFSKNIGTDDPQHILLYDIKKPIELFLRIDSDIRKIKINDLESFEIKKEYQKFELWYNGKIFDVLENVFKFPGGNWEMI